MAKLRPAESMEVVRLEDKTYNFLYREDDIFFMMVRLQKTPLSPFSFHLRCPLSLGSKDTLIAVTMLCRRVSPHNPVRCGTLSKPFPDPSWLLPSIPRHQDPETFEQISMDLDKLGDVAKYLEEGSEVKISFHQGEPITGIVHHRPSLALPGMEEAAEHRV